MGASRNTFPFACVRRIGGSRSTSIMERKADRPHCTIGLANRVRGFLPCSMSSWAWLVRLRESSDDIRSRRRPDFTGKCFALLVCQKRGRRLPERSDNWKKAPPPRMRGEASGQSGRDVWNAAAQAALFRPLWPSPRGSQSRPSGPATDNHRARGPTPSGARGFHPSDPA